MALLRGFLSAGVLYPLLAGPALAQSAQNVVTQAEDAFGERIGIERIGLYNESQVRGFSLAEAGNYRIDGAYFVRAAGLGNPVVAGVTTRVGVNALSADFPAPSGIVDYRLRTGGETPRLDVEAGMVEFGGGYVNVTGSAATPDGKLRVSGGAQLQPHRHFASSARGSQYDFGIVPEWRPNATTSLIGFFGYGTLGYWGEFLHTPTTDRLPPKLHFPRRYTASWSDWKADNTNGGLIFRTAVGAWNFQASAFYSRAGTERGDYTLITSDSEGRGRATGIYARPRESVAKSGEVKLSRVIAPGHRLFAMMRARRSDNKVRPSVSVDIGPVDQSHRTPITAAPVVGPADPTLDEVRQITGGFGYEGQISRRLRIRAGIQRTHYRKSVAIPDGPVNDNEETTWLYDASAVFAVAERWTLFATATRGIEESGSAPANSLNRYEVLPAVIARQYELGFRGRIGTGLSLIGSVFEVSKPTPGLDPDGVYRLIGEESHRGVELSLTGRVTPSLTTVAGLVVLDPKMSGELVRLGRQSDRAMGVSSVIGVASFNYEPPPLPGLSIDGQLTYNGDRLVHPTNGLETPAHTLVDLGGRYRFRIHRHDAVLRVYAGNIFGTNAWTGLRSGSMLRTAPRSLRATLTVSFD